MRITKKLYEQMQDEHVAYLYKHFGKDVSCNLGWSTDDTGMCTKIYTSPLQFLSTSILEDGRIIHEVTTD